MSSLANVPQVRALGGVAALSRQGLEHIPHPDPPEALPSLPELGRAADERERSFGRKGGAPMAVCGDMVARFGELAAARGALGRCGRDPSGRSC